jgi:hypothetical protein
MVGYRHSKNLVVGHAINIIILEQKQWVEQYKDNSRRKNKMNIPIIIELLEFELQELI